MLFNVMFLEKVARPNGQSLNQVKESYDSSWGRVSDDVIAEIKRCHQSIMAVKTLQEVMERVRGGKKLSWN